MRNSHWLGLAACVIAQAAMAAPAASTPASNSGAARRLTAIEAETAVLKAQQRKLEVQAQIATKQAEIAAREGEARRAALVRAGEAPVLRGIDGVGKRLFASVEVPGYGMLDVGAGDKLPDGSRVVSVGTGEIVIEGAGRKRTTLGVAPSSPGATAQHVDGGHGALPVGLPELPPVRGVRR
jgi:type IV pilus biogenesis protein PilP